MFVPPKTVLLPNDIPAVSIDFMNHTHYEEVVLVNNLGQLIEEYKENTAPSMDDTQKISTLLDQWLEHTVEHFTRENELMMEYHFPAYETHFNEHEISLNKIKMVIQTWKNANDIKQLAEFVFVIWPAWFNGHVASMDNVTAQYAIMHGYSDNQAKAS